MFSRNTFICVSIQLKQWNIFTERDDDICSCKFQGLLSSEKVKQVCANTIA